MPTMALKVFLDHGGPFTPPISLEVRTTDVASHAVLSRDERWSRLETEIRESLRRLTAEPSDEGYGHGV